ncbi:mannose-1-phosphate guanylyltransferase/mannose-6-phosphate isomerase [Ahrensia sp. R2A130]|uniref:mannose-1-phosphate guanylyltransferase/mannose-6-phosphate isomerase n=1 Tax=Ahrensia sp. R2A130 TaxID=744979 RepID=UPI0001E0949D|nr:mannose-1-phosphate guanylyltransferase/mannose-6-phosphate isomerase [Ahrensia sp. R2A130]EFL88353.1 mannose-1-phosphate guanylyltransferase/mannose-6-phosphate isomerase [Ahrensia sp. R2A130]
MTKEQLLPVILAGGGGTRLWPLSRTRHGKPFLDLTGDGSLLMQTLQRAALVTDTAPIIVCGEEERFLAAEELRSSEISGGRILLEAVQRNTAPALTLAALEATRDGADPLLLVLPSDHIIDNVAFVEALAVAALHAGQGQIVTMAVTPEGPQTGYGYLQLRKSQSAGDASFVDGFIEKPGDAAAKALIKSGNVAWNAGIFVLRASSWLSEVEQHAPDIISACRSAFDKRSADADFIRVDAAAFAKSPNISIDYAVMEHATNLVAVPLHANWSDLGTFDALAHALPKDEHDNAIVGDVVTHDSRRNFLHAESRLLTVAGLSDMVVVETADAVFVAPRNSANLAGGVAKALSQSGRSEAAQHTRVQRPWGRYVILAERKDHVIKRITVNPGRSLSLQRHKHRSEHWLVQSGVATIELDGVMKTLAIGQSIDIPKGAVHALSNESDKPLVIIEVQMGEHLSEDDIERLEDRYGRAGPNA